MTKEEVLKYNGLDNESIRINYQKYGSNTLSKKKKTSFLKAFLMQFVDPMVILLTIAALISLSLAIYEHVSGQNKGSEIIISYVEPGIIMLVLILNSLLGAFQLIKSEQAVLALEKVNEANATVKRNNEMMSIPASQLLPGDLLFLNAGDTINADGRIISSSNFEVVESSLTGESNSVVKMANWTKQNDKTLAENNHYVYSGTYVTKGTAVVYIEKIAKETEIGKINSLIQNQNKAITPLQYKLNKLSKIFGYSGVVLLFVSFLVQVLLNNLSTGIWTNPQVYTNGFVTGISLAVAAIPEGLITFTTVLLSIGVAQLTKENAIAKNLLAVETLGSTNIICSDKTGTLTENKMTVVEAFTKNNFYEKDKNNDVFSELAKYLVLCNDAHLTMNKENNNYEEIGDPTETGLLRFGLNFGLTKEELLKQNELLQSQPFDSDRKLMSVLIKQKESNLIIVKGAPDVVIDRCKGIDREKLIKINEEWSSKTYRVLAAAIKKTSKSKITLNDEKDLEFVGFVAMIDPPRANIKESISMAKKAGIKTIMITGDHITTAKAIASNLGIFSKDDLAINGEQLSKMSDQELKDKVHLITVYARVNPSDKLRIVNAWKERDKVVAMTGDGVNDAPALKASDIGCAMGITGTEVSKQAADLILVDDNFNTIVGAVKNGRLIFDKIKTVILNMLISSLTEILVMLIGMVVFFLAYKDFYKEGFYIYSASQLLWVNFVTHGIPAIALGFVDSGKNVMNRSPYSKKESIFARGMGIELIWQSLVLSLLSLVSYAIAMEYNKNLGPGREHEIIALASTCSFTTLGVAASLNAINLMSDKSIFTSSIKKYYIVWIAALTSTIMILLVVLTPDVANVFRMSNEFVRNWKLVLISVGLGLTLTVASEFKKIILFAKSKLSKTN
ncbi:cation-translocating P-type ATPase [Mycoplasma sp. Mirounga ES2805-ORL]|uniref:cation-translocating P-type ATPase n=1 Tax=Mycoplasma sp. Mirounga ES2805-ORL TaxID=754514 RepID=UPI00197B08D4|nr:cation-translocating P-type ATPase [Mycoplasma sp. Mirounga ES2805-ORL]QSF13715.1 cation-translocating P-type ATPase [Mycoplasma sp. Mirounga ES2805-ORL]